MEEVAPVVQVARLLSRLDRPLVRQNHQSHRAVAHRQDLQALPLPPPINHQGSSPRTATRGTVIIDTRRLLEFIFSYILGVTVEMEAIHV